MEELVPRSAVVYTPTRLARAMVAAMGDHEGARWLDPCVGDGAFVEEIAALPVPKERITAFDINRNPSEKEERAQTYWEKDFIEWVLDEQTREPVAPFDRIILNPPYVALSRISKLLSERAVSLELPDGSKLPMTANYWCAFLIASLKVLAPEGSLCAVLPAAWDYAYYARDVREYLKRAFDRFVEIRSRKPLFSDVQEGSVVIVGRGYAGFIRRERGLSRIERHQVGNAEEMQEKLYELAKWLGAHDGRPHGTRGVGEPEVRRKLLRDIVDIRIGAVTGDSRYFVLSEKQRVDQKLPQKAFRRVLSRANHLSAAIIDKKLWEELRDDNRRIWLFRPLGAVRKEPAVRRYLRLPEDKGGCRRKHYKIDSRKPWSITPLPGRIDGFLSGMSKSLPFLVLKGKDIPDLTATNTLYVVRFKDRLSLEQKAAWGVTLLSSSVRRQMEQRARVYADGLRKLEPSELGSLEVPEPPTRRGAITMLSRATQLLLAGKQAEAEALADTWLGLKKEAVQMVLPGTSQQRVTNLADYQRRDREAQSEEETNSSRASTPEVESNLLGL